MLPRLVTAVLRAAIVMLAVSLPSLLLPGTSREGAELVVLVALVLGLFTAVEYGATYPALIEFRDAPPFNRLRVLALIAMLLALSLVARGDSGSSLMILLHAIGLLFGHALEFPASPMSALIAHLSHAGEPVSQSQIKIMAGLALCIALVVMVCFSVTLRSGRWPQTGQAFNVWINLPTFDPTTGRDVVGRLVRDARVNLIFAFTIIFILPMLGLMMSGHLGLDSVTSAHALVWGITLWMFLPLSLGMRALAMLRIAGMIRDRRARLVAGIGADGAQPA